MTIKLYYFASCPYCKKVMRFIEEKGIKNIIYKDIHSDSKALQELIEIGGKNQVPCLIIDKKAMYESDDIIQWLKEYVVK